MVKSTIVFEVGMTCDGCSGAVTRILNKINGVKSIDCNIPQKLVTVEYEGDSIPNTDEILQKLVKWGTAAGKSVELKTVSSY